MIKNNGNFSSIVLRYNSSKNGQTKNINYAKDYEIEKIIKNIKKSVDKLNNL